ncbi:MAG: hypothetical protein ACFFAS_05405 [Promethearchaeota archaeon]
MLWGTNAARLVQALITIVIFQPFPELAISHPTTLLKKALSNRVGGHIEQVF